MNIKLIINRAGAWILTVIFFGGVYLGLVSLYRYFVSTRTDIFFLSWTILYGILVGETFLKVRLFLQTKADKKFIRGWYDFDKVVTEISDKFASITKTEDLFLTIKAIFKEKLEIDEFKIFTAEKDKDFNPIAYKELENNEKLDINHLLIRFLKERHQYLFESGDLPKNLQRENIYLYLPFYSLTRTLEGFVLLGKKASEEPYNETDFNLFKSILSQSVSILDRIKPYEKIRRDFEAAQKKLYDTERLLARSEKIAAMANLIQEYNHEIKTPLTIIKGEAEELPEKQRDSEYLKKTADLMMKHINRIDDIVESTLRLSKPKERTEVELDLNAVIEEALRLFPPNGVHLTKELGAIPNIRGDKDDLQMLFVNLIKNAVEAMPDGGDLTIKTYPASSEDGGILVCIDITDTGCGIAKENMEKIFEPFFSTHVTKGRGLGLSIAFRIVREHLGKIEVESKVGSGSTFKIQFRAAKK